MCLKHLKLDNCAGLVRQEKLSGKDVFPYATTPLADSIEERIRKLSSYLKSSGVRLPKSLTSKRKIQWRKLRVGGHSQGAGIAYYLAKKKGVAHACFLGGPYDIPDSVDAKDGFLIADWFLKRKESTPAFSMKAAIVAEDASYREFVYAYGVMGLAQNTEWFSVGSQTGVYHDVAGKEIGAHGAIMRDPRFSRIRKQLCFE
jgi:hypothetical protein